MRTQDIEIVLAIRDQGSFSKAADTLELSQPAVSLAVKRVEEELDIRIFDRSGPSVALTIDGHRVIRGFDRMMGILREIKGRRAETQTLRLGLSPLLSGRDVARLLGTAIRNRSIGFVIEFLDSNDIAARSDFDVKVMTPSVRRRSNFTIELETCWIGADNGVFIRSKQESPLWDRAMHSLIDHGIAVDKIVEVNDCGYAYHMASSGAGFTPCALTTGSPFRDKRLPKMPELQPVRLDVFADQDILDLLKEALIECETSPRAGHA